MDRRRSQAGTLEEESRTLFIFNAKAVNVVKYIVKKLFIRSTYNVIRSSFYIFARKETIDVDISIISLLTILSERKYDVMNN